LLQPVDGRGLDRHHLIDEVTPLNTAGQPAE
jgi:hypothetical protein